MKTFTQKHYIAIAAILKDSRSASSGLADNEWTVNVTTTRFAEAFKADNPNFKGHLFAKAAGYTGDAAWQNMPKK
jgi:hypothetical protein